MHGQGGPVRDLPPRPVTVLVAGDDDREDTKQLLRELTSAGYELRWVVSAEEAARAPYAIVSTRALGELAELRHDALHDPLTGLPNRALFLDRLELSLKRARRHGDEFCCAVLFCDLDRFKVVNDSLGHIVGDRLLMAIAKRIEAALRPGDTVARHGGDEFTLLLDDVVDARGASIVAERLQETLAAPFEVDNRELYVTASIGISLVAPGRAPEDVVRDADVAMYRAKAQGGARHAVFDEAMHERVMERLELETGLRHALERGQVRVLYQPVIETATGEISSFEALCRWTDGDGRAIAPRDFVPIADETGLILPLGGFVLAEACRQLAIWRKHPRGKELSISVNISGRQLSDPGFVDLVTGALADARLDPGGLRIEVSERSMMDDPEAARRILGRLFDERSVAARIDDFGLGASSVRQLHRFPGDAVKLDRSFVVPMLEDAGAFDIVKAIVSLAHNLGMEVIAEGVETQAHLDRLKLLGCEYAQGFYIAGPLDAGAATALLERGTADAVRE
jgi:diguanylate cyclase (GGDEF)-like protein